jgi:hypothetical protein
MSLINISKAFSHFNKGGRPLTAGEIMLAYSIFGDNIEYSKIRIHNGLGLYGKIHKAPGMSPDGHIYFQPDAYCDDFSLQTLDEQRFFIHEMMHVLQFQQGRDVIGGFLKNMIAYRGKYEDCYHYDTMDLSLRGFDKLNIEQQARFVDRYFIKKKINEFRKVEHMSQEVLDKEEEYYQDGFTEAQAYQILSKHLRYEAV